MHPMLYKVPPNCRNLNRRIYWTPLWKGIRRKQLSREPFCRYCAEQGLETRARYADHIIPHRGDPNLFFDDNNLQSLCETHHNATKQSEEIRQVRHGCTIDGFPLDPEHHWNGGNSSPKPLLRNEIHRRRHG